MKKRNYLLIILLVSIGLLAGCGNDKKEASENQSNKKLKIGILQLMDHSALNDAREGFIEEVKRLGVDAEIDYQNAFGEIPMTVNIANKFVNDKVDLIFAIGTPAAQSAKEATSEIPILFSAVTDPVGAGLVNSVDKVGTNVTGTIDAADVKAQLEIFSELDKSIKDIGIIYNTSEANSVSQVEEVEKIAPNLGLNIVTTGITNVNELNQGLNSLIKKVDAMYILSDNITASAVDLVSSTLIENNILSVCAEESQVGGGILITKGHSYYELGKKTGQLAKEILLDKKDISSLPIYPPENLKLKLNEKTYKALKLDENSSLYREAEKIGK